MSTATITIGRNIGDRPMSLREWNAYVGEVRADVASWADDVIVDADYDGLWQGVREDAHIILAAADQLPPDIRERLARRGRAHGQDAIGLTVGTGELV